MNVELTDEFKKKHCWRRTNDEKPLKNVLNWYKYLKTGKKHQNTVS